MLCFRSETAPYQYGQCLLSEHKLHKESIVIMKKFDFEILAYLYILRFPQFICAIFTVMHACMC